MQHSDRQQWKDADTVAVPRSALGRAILDKGLASAPRIRDAEQAALAHGTSLPDALRLRLSLPADLVATLEAEAAGLGTVDPSQSPPDRSLVEKAGVLDCLRHGYLPWQTIAGATVVLVPHAHPDPHVMARISLLFGRVRLALCSEEKIQSTIRIMFAGDLVVRAETLVPDHESCRSWNPAFAARITLGCVLFCVACLVAWPATSFAILFAMIVFWSIAGNLLKGAATLARLSMPTVQPPPLPQRLPVVTLMVPLYRESEIAARLIDRLSAIDYPPELLDICLLLEEDDRLTRKALAAANLPRFIRAIVVPDGSVRTKPRALNFGMNFARGTIIGVYDAEDCPDPQQIRTVVSEFARSGPDVACLQGVLDFYNTRKNWLARCFTLEYATWFRVVLPGLERLGFLIPLGGTTLFFRRNVIEELGGWDAHNVTEDADLGVRLTRHGYRTRLIPTVTGEEANCRIWPWIKQRSRWLKGYAITYGVHMRHPVALWRDLGAWRFAGFQIQFLGTLTQFVTAPLLWTLWLIPFGVPHPLAVLLPPTGLVALSVAFAVVEAINIGAALFGARLSGRLWLWPWVPVLHVYFPLASLAAYKGLGELLHRPFYWDKTAHGISDQEFSTAAASSLSRVTNALEM